MTEQQIHTVVKKQDRIAWRININTIVTTLVGGVITAAVLWAGSGFKAAYDQLHKQPMIDAAQDVQISAMGGTVKVISDNFSTLGNRISYLEAILPDKQQFKIKP